MSEWPTILNPAVCDHADHDVRRFRISEDQLERAVEAAAKE
jgi:hypothetical protein